MKTRTHIPMDTPFGVIDFEAYLTSAVDLQTNEISVFINFLGSDNIYSAATKTNPQNAFNLHIIARRNEHIYDEIMSDLENCNKFEAWFTENVLDDVIQECKKCYGAGTVIVGERCYEDGRGGYDFGGGDEIDCPRCEGLKYEIKN